MNRKFFLGFFAALSLSCAPAFADRGAGFVELSGGEKIFTSYHPAERGHPTLILLNGLTYSLSDWDSYTKALTKLDSVIGILRFDMIGMGETLLKGALPVKYEISYKRQVELTHQLMNHFKIRKAFVAGLSYGGAIAIAFAHAHPEKVEKLILMAPFTEPLKAMDKYIRDQIAATRLAFPFNPATDDELYDFFLRQFIYAVYPSLEPSVLENPFKLEAIFRVIQGVRKYNALNDASQLPALSTHLLVAKQDQYIAKDVLDRFWNAVPASARASRIDISQSEHKIPQAIPEFAAAWTAEILNGRAELSKGLSFDGDTGIFTAVSGNLEIRLPRRRN